MTSKTTQTNIWLTKQKAISAKLANLENDIENDKHRIKSSLNVFIFADKPKFLKKIFMLFFQENNF